MDPYTRHFGVSDQGVPAYSYNRPIASYPDQNKVAATAPLTSNYPGYPSKYTSEDRKSVRGYSPARGDNNLEAASKPSKISKENDVLSRANEVLQRSLRFTNANANASANVPASYEPNPQAKSYTFTATATTTTATQNLTQNAKTQEVLNRANAILNRSANYSKDPTVHLAEKSNFAKTFTSFNRTDISAKETLPTQSEAPINYAEELASNNNTTLKTTNPRNILSRVDQALQSSNQISANPNPSGIDRTLRYNEDRLPAEPSRSYDNREGRSRTPQKTSYDYRSPSKEQRYQDSRVGSNSKTIKASEYAARNNRELHTAYTEALRRSQELVERNEVELMKSANKRAEMNLKSSYVMERQTNMRTSSPYDDDKGEDASTPGIYIPAQGIKPKFCEEYYEDGTIYKGEKIRTAKHGRGEFLYSDASRYEGEWESDRKNGYGVQTFPNGTIQYDGEWKDDVYHGNGILMNGDATEERNFKYQNFETLENNWIKYEGEFMNGKMHGLGTLTLFNNERYVGKFKYDQVHGAGVFHKQNGEAVSGEWENSKFVKNL